MPRRLVILGSTITALAVARDAHAHGLAAMVIDTQDGIAFRSRWVIGTRLPAEVCDDVVLSTLRELSEADACLVATGDTWVRFIMRQRAAVDHLFRAVWHPDNATLDICLDKRRFAAWCAATGLSAPRAWLAGREPRPQDLVPPYLIRPAETQHGRPNHGLPKAVEANSESELAAWLRRFEAAHCPALVTESLLRQPLTQYSVPFARTNGRLVSFVARKLRPPPERCAVGTCVEMSPQPQVEALGRSAAEALGYFGVGEAEVLYSHADERAYLIEINARPWLQYALAPASGHDFLGLLLGRPSAVGREVKTGRCWIDLRSDLFTAFSSSEGVVRKGKVTVGAYVASLARVNVFARFDWRDPAPAWFKQPNIATDASPQADRAGHGAA